jgi:hypothetical protein
MPRSNTKPFVKIRVLDGRVPPALVNHHGAHRHLRLRRKRKDYFGSAACPTHGCAGYLSGCHLAAALARNRCSRFSKFDKEGHAGDEWISDGNFALATFDIRLPRATLVIWLERSKLFCAWRAVTRTFKRGEAHRVAGLTKVLAFIWKFDRVNRPRIEATRLSFGPGVPVHRLRNSRDIAVFLSSVQQRQ